MSFGGSVSSRPVGFDDRLRARLREDSILPDVDTYRRVRQEIARLGEAELARIRTIAGSDWEDDLARLKGAYEEADNRRVLGFGHVLTEFIVAPLDLPDDVRPAVVELGTTANLLVATFDQLVDHGHDPEGVLSARGLRVAAGRNRPQGFPSGLEVPATERAMVRLAARYFDRLEALPHTDSRPDVRRAHDEYVAEMYRAERRTLTASGGAVANAVTSVYPFVVMGLPGWLATPTFAESSYREHVAWLHRLGTFAGLVDEAVDLREDATAGAYNAVAARRARESDEAVLADVAALGRAVLDEWAAMTTITDHPPATVEALSTCIGSWFGGVGPE